MPEAADIPLGQPSPPPESAGPGAGPGCPWHTWSCRSLGTVTCRASPDAASAHRAASWCQLGAPQRGEGSQLWPRTYLSPRCASNSDAVPGSVPGPCGAGSGMRGATACRGFICTASPANNCARLQYLAFR